MLEGINFSNYTLKPLNEVGNLIRGLLQPSKPDSLYENLTLFPPDVFLGVPAKAPNNSVFSNFSFIRNTPVGAPATLNRIGNLGVGIVGKSNALAVERLKQMTPAQLKELGQRNKSEFFKALLPAALESERRYGVPASVTLAQAALESGWAKSPIGGYNIFGIKGKGPAGTVSVRTKEYVRGRYISIVDNFARYNNFYEAVMEHGKLFQKHATYRKGVEQFARDNNDYKFIQTIGRTYATSPTYSQNIQKMMRDYNLVNLTNNAYA